MKAGFGEKRKQLKNSLSGGLNIGMEAATELIDAAGLPSTARAQELCLSQWQDLYTSAIKRELLS
jgi:16S rRNA A1518/A1519 N6-dimethyltransferase RsmA/KsgA/DIM1 with predicted DNA glycosylase/AP lyase activity